MGIDFYFGNNTEILIESFFKSIHKERNLDDPFYAPLVIVPNVNLVKYLKMYIAEKQNICLNFKFMFLENGITYALSELEKKTESEKKENIFLGHKSNHLELQLMLLHTITNTEEFDIIKRYTGDKKNSGSYIKRIWQLSDKLTLYFREYEYQRMDMLSGWLDNRLTHNNNEIEKLQSVIYNKIFGKEGIVYSSNMKSKEYFFTTLPSYAKSIFADPLNNHSLNKNFIYFFGFSQISQFHYDIIFKLSEYYEIRFFKLNFLYEFNNDLADDDRWKNIEKLKIQNNKVVPNDKENYLVKIWATPSRESIKLLGDIIKKNESINIRSFWNKNEKREIVNPTVLNILQNKIANETLYKFENKKIEQDTSLQIVNCPDIFREIQTIYNSIIYNMKNDNNLKLTDIAILIPNIRKYISPVKSFFLNDSSLIPFNLSDINAADESLFGKALIKILEIANNNFTRKDIIDLLNNEIFLLSNKISYDDVNDFIKWIDDLNIYAGFEEEDNALYSWQQGLTRLKFGYIMEYSDNENFENFNNIVPYTSMGTSDTEKLNLFICLIENLFSRLKKIKQTGETGHFWITFIKDIINDFLRIPEDIPPHLKGEKDVLHKILIDLDRLILFDNLSGNLNFFTIDYILEFINSNLINIDTSIGNYLTDGITISSLMPLRPIPFKIIYIVGLGEGDFPGINENSNIDLRNIRRVIGDISKIEANKYLFLETIMSAKQKLYLTYVGKDIQKDQILFPNSLLLELKSFLNENIVESFCEIEIPLQEFSTRYYLKKEKWNDILVNYDYYNNLFSLVRIKENNASLFTEEQINTIETNILREKEKNNICIFKKENEYNDTTIKISDLVKFLISPLKTKIKRYLSIPGFEEEDYSLKEDEPFYSVFPINYSFSLAPLIYYIRNSFKGECNIDQTLDYFDNYYKHEKIKSNTPDYDFGKIDKTSFLNNIEKRLQEKENGIIDFLNRMQKEQYKFYDNISFDKVSFNFEDAIFNVYGKTEKNHFTFLNNNNIEMLILTNSSDTEKSNNKLSKYVFSPLIFSFFILLERDNFDIKDDFINLRINISYLNNTELSSLSYKLDMSSVNEYLTNLIKAFVDKNNFYFPSFEVINSIVTKIKTDNNDYWNKDNFTEDIIKEEIKTSEDNYLSNRKALDITNLIKIKIQEDCYTLIKERYKLIYNYNK